MDPVSPFPAIASLLVAVAMSFLLVKRFGTPPDQGRFASIDGLRGYLAYFVFLHHSCVWYFYLRTGQWKVPPSNFYTHLGQSSVALFFMITGFLFFSKLIDGRKKNIDWEKLFISRFLRLIPLYLFALILLFIIVASLSEGTLNEPLPKLLKSIVRWIGFTILGSPNLNGIKQTSVIVAGVMWSLPYEWFFYFSLPLLALSVRVQPPLPFLLLGVASIAGLAIWHPQTHHVMSFFGGIAAAYFVRSNLFRKFAARKVSSFIALGCVSIAVASYPSAYSVIPLLLLSVAFILIACGNTLFGVLISPISRTLGEMTYSIYLLHGITLFVTFNFILGMTESRALSAFAHWLVVVGITPILLFGCFLSFRFIERPAMLYTEQVLAWRRTRLCLRSKLRAASAAPIS